jgi:hypothetical protein
MSAQPLPELAHDVSALYVPVLAASDGHEGRKVGSWLVGF